MATRNHVPHVCTCLLYKASGVPFYGLIVLWPLADDRARVWEESARKECLLGIADVTQIQLKTVGRYTLG